MEEKMGQDTGKIRKTLEKREKEGGGKKKRRWNMESRENKTHVRRKLTNWRRGKGRMHQRKKRI